MASNYIKSQRVAFGDGWQPANESWAYASADDPTFTFTIAGVDLTSKYSPGMRVKLTQTTVKYFIITAVAFSTNTTITVYGGTDYDLANAAITSPYYSTQKAPQGFPLDPTKWTVIVTDTTSRRQVSPTANTWYNIGSINIVVPIGVWRVSYQGNMIAYVASSGDRDVTMTLSTANNSESDVDFSGNSWLNGNGFRNQVYKEKTLVLAAKTTYYLIHKTLSSGMTLIGSDNDQGKLTIRAICEYL